MITKVSWVVACLLLRHCLNVVALFWVVFRAWLMTPSVSCMVARSLLVRVLLGCCCVLNAC